MLALNIANFAAFYNHYVEAHSACLIAVIYCTTCSPVYSAGFVLVTPFAPVSLTAGQPPVP